MSTVLDGPARALIEEHVRRLIHIMGFESVRVQCHVDNEDALHINLEAGSEGKMLIGTRGSHLLALQHIIRCLLRKELSAVSRILVDVNGYRSRRERTLLDLAEETARKAQRTGRTVVLQPMTAADRRAIHAALANHKDVTTESLGDEPNRRVVVRPIFL